MHDHTTEHDDYLWPTCAGGPTTGPRSHPLWENELDRLVCWPCEQKTAARITELPALFAQLNQTAMLMKGANRVGGGTSGTRTAPIPPRLDVLNLVGPGGIAARLRDIEDAWRTAFGRTIKPATDGIRVFAWSRSNPARAIPGHAEFLAINLRKACEQYESIGQDITDLRRLHTECTALANNEPRPGHVQIGACPGRINDALCTAPLTASAASHRVHCRTCGSRWETMGEWRDLRAAQEAVAAGAAGVAA